MTHRVQDECQHARTSESPSKFEFVYWMSQYITTLANKHH